MAPAPPIQKIGSHGASFPVSPPANGDSVSSFRIVESAFAGLLDGGKGGVSSAQSPVQKLGSHGASASLPVCSPANGDCVASATAGRLDGGKCGQSADRVLSALVSTMDGVRVSSAQRSAPGERSFADVDLYNADRVPATLGSIQVSDSRPSASAPTSLDAIAHGACPARASVLPVGSASVAGILQALLWRLIS